MGKQILWTAIIAVVATVVAKVLFNASGFDDAGWAGGIGAGIGAAGGMLIAAKVPKNESAPTDDSTESSGG